MQCGEFVSRLRRLFILEQLRDLGAQTWNWWHKYRRAV